MFPNANLPFGGTVQIDLDLSEVKGLIRDRAANQREADKFLSTAGMTVAKQIATLARKRLEVGGNKNIGTTGRASKNIFIKKVGETGAVVYEGAYPANYFIRMGRRQDSTPPPIKAILDWLVHKPGFDFSPQKENKRNRWTKFGGPRANLRSQPSRPFKRDLKGTAHAIANKIGKIGMWHLVPFYPKGQPKYDYYSEILTRTPGPNHFRTLIADTFNNDFFVAYARWLRDGIPVKMDPIRLGGTE